ncbi:MAG: molybdopterin-guanine dinucleotide biosynthesis protein B [Thermoplasmata archaeon]
MPVNIHLSGNSGSGKTTIAEYFIGAARSRITRICYLKNIPHDDVAFDMSGKDTERALGAGAVLSVGRAERSTFMTFGSKLSLKDLLEKAKSICDVCLIEGFHDEIKDIRISISISLVQDSPQSGQRRILIKSDDGSFAEFDSPSYLEDANAYAIEKIEGILHDES